MQTAISLTRDMTIPDYEEIFASLKRLREEQII